MYHPDEFWQSTEIAYSDVYKYKNYIYENRVGERPWEWDQDNALRNPVYTMVFRFYYEIIKFLKIDCPDLVVKFIK